MTDSAPGVEHLDVVDEIGRYVRTAPRDEVHERGEWHRVFHCQIVTLRDDRPLTGYALARDEVDAVLDVPIADLLALLNGAPSITVQGVSSAGHPDAREIALNATLDDFVPNSEYWVVLMVMAQRFLAGQRPLAVWQAAEKGGKSGIGDSEAAGQSVAVSRDADFFSSLPDTGAII